MRRTLSAFLTYLLSRERSTYTRLLLDSARQSTYRWHLRWNHRYPVNTEPMYLQICPSMLSHNVATLRHGPSEKRTIFIQQASNDKIDIRIDNKDDVMAYWQQIKINCLSNVRHIQLLHTRTPVLLRFPSVLLDFPYKGHDFKSIESLLSECCYQKRHSKLWLCRQFWRYMIGLKNKVHLQNVAIRNNEYPYYRY
jgi:hypothetical protein